MSSSHSDVSFPLTWVYSWKRFWKSMVKCVWNSWFEATDAKNTCVCEVSWDFLYYYPCVKESVQFKGQVQWTEAQHTRARQCATSPRKALLASLLSKYFAVFFECLSRSVMISLWKREGNSMSRTEDCSRKVTEGSQQVSFMSDSSYSPSFSSLSFEDVLRSSRS